jgi:hypothetical protein
LPDNWSYSLCLCAYGSRAHIICDKREIKVVSVELNLRSLHDKPEQAQRGGGGTVSIHSQPGSVRRRWFSAPCFGQFCFSKDIISIVQEAVWAFELIWMACKI